MRTTLDLDPDVLMAAKELARRQRKTAGQIVSQLLREALNQGSSVSEEPGSYGFRPFPSRGGVVTNSLIDELREDFGD
ncbi:MAG: antitoxin [Gammaproteobacteria bacterium]|nr:antitoxin [Gammaproteobacteria bacterium]MDE0479533.1 antitoxin [Gammaproteobacteria bacterium]MDE0508647.1 antitoxin [Gammaproteobacteria bacterium]MXY90141.1 antitoxin [Gammaproteobacteria bacterium]MYG95688.1 antitoxin [Gammaproteobacteria bacterium]